MMLNSYQIALLILEAHHAYSSETGRSLSRFRLSRKTFRKISGRKHLRDALIDEVQAELAEFGWALFAVDEQFAILRLDRVETWQRIAAGRINAMLREAQNNPDKFNFNELAERYLSAVVDEDVSDD